MPPTGGSDFQSDWGGEKAYAELARLRELARGLVERMTAVVVVIVQHNCPTGVKATPGKLFEAWQELGAIRDSLEAALGERKGEK